MKDVVIVGGCRTAVGTMGGSLKDIHESELCAHTIKAALERAGVAPEQVDEVIVGIVGQIAESGFIARMCALKAGLPLETTAYSVNRQCGSGLQAINDAARMIRCGDADIVVAAGCENMNALPYYVRKGRYGYRFGNGVLEDGLSTILTWPMGPYPNGVTAENVATKYNISRQDQDQFALDSQQKALAAIAQGKFSDEIIPIEIKEKKNVRLFDTDEHPRAGLSMEKLSGMKPAFVDGGTVTAANSSGINDGAAAVVMMSADKAKELGLKPLMRVVQYAVSGNHPDYMGFAPALSTKKLLDNAHLRMDDIGLIELNEAFASQSLAVIREIGMPVDRVNVNGGAIALGHPIGATGVILTVKLMYELIRRKEKYGIVAMCIGGGQGISTLFEHIQA